MRRGKNPRRWKSRRAGRRALRYKRVPPEPLRVVATDAEAQLASQVG
jgi:hypothetical protein